MNNLNILYTIILFSILIYYSFLQKENYNEPVFIKDNSNDALDLMYEELKILDKRLDNVIVNNSNTINENLVTLGFSSSPNVN